MHAREQASRQNHEQMNAKKSVLLHDPKVSFSYKPRGKSCRHSDLSAPPKHEVRKKRTRRSKRLLCARYPKACSSGVYSSFFSQPLYFSIPIHSLCTQPTLPSLLIACAFYPSLQQSRSALREPHIYLSLNHLATKVHSRRHEAVGTCVRSKDIVGWSRPAGIATATNDSQSRLLT